VSVPIRSIVELIAALLRLMCHIDSWRHSFTTCRVWQNRDSVSALLGGYSLAGTYRLQSGNAQSPFVGGIDLNGDGSATNDRPVISNPSAAANSVGFSNFIAENFISGVTSPTGFSDLNGNPVNPSDVRFLVSESIRTGIAAATSCVDQGRTV
jgi:hypothetical protein